MKIHVEFDNKCWDTDISEAFGIGDSFVTEVDADVPDDFSVMLITGESGSGKSVIARQIGTSTPIRFDRNAPISEALPMAKEESLRWLSSFGLGDAKIFTLPYSHLSDSQMARFDALASTVGVPVGGTVVIDEFLSTLDRSTAKFVAYSIRKSVVRTGRRLIAVTAMDDIESWLMPDVVVRGKAFPRRFDTTTGLEWGGVLDGVEFRYLDAEAYRECNLGDLHYRGKYTGGAKDYLFAYFGDEPIAVLVATNRIGAPSAARRIARLVVHPKARGCGIGAMTVRRFLADNPDTDVVAAMARYSSVFEAAGMSRISDSIQNPPTGLRGDLKSMGFDAAWWHDIDSCRNFMEDEDHRIRFSKYASRCTKLIQPGGAHLSSEEIASRLASDADTAGRCLYWLRPRKYAKFVGSGYSGVR